MKPRMLGIILIIIGVISLIAGVSLCRKSNNTHTPSSIPAEVQKVVEMASVDGVLTPKEEELIAKTAAKYNVLVDEIIEKTKLELKNCDTIPETEIIDVNKRKGDDFEKFIVKILVRNKYLKLKDWTGDKYIDGIYSKTNQNPDLIVKSNLAGKYQTFAIECKWRNNFRGNAVKIAEEQQLKRYKKYQSEQEITVYITLGIGGTPSSPDELYIINIEEIQKNEIEKDDLRNHLKEKKENDYFFYFNSKNGKLS